MRYQKILYYKTHEKALGLRMPQEHNSEVGIPLLCPNYITIPTLDNPYKDLNVRMIDTYLRVALPNGYFGLIAPVYNTLPMYCNVQTQVIISSVDSISVTLTNIGPYDFTINPGETIAQLVIMSSPLISNASSFVLMEVADSFHLKFPPEYKVEDTY